MPSYAVQAVIAVASVLALGYLLNKLRRSRDYDGTGGDLFDSDSGSGSDFGDGGGGGGDGGGGD
jgi:hypothetical protein